MLAIAHGTADLSFVGDLPCPSKPLFPYFPANPLQEVCERSNWYGCCPQFCYPSVQSSGADKRKWTAPSQDGRAKSQLVPSATNGTLDYPSELFFYLQHYSKQNLCQSFSHIAVLFCIVVQTISEKFSSSVKPRHHSAKRAVQDFRYFLVGKVLHV